jgi:tetratricopeptide (TPR) repeat protein
MTAKEINPIYERIIPSLDQRELKAAFDLLQQLVSKSNNYLFQDELFEMQETYKQMLHYYFAGSNDPMRQKIFMELMASIYEITDKITQKIQTVDSPEMFYEIRRIATVHPVSISHLTETIRSAYDIQNIAHAESLMPQLFKAIWTSAALPDDDMESLQRSLHEDENATGAADNQGYQTIVNCQIVAALFVGLQAFFDKRKMLLLIHAAGSPDEAVKIRAYTGLLITLFRYKQRIDYYPELKYRIDMLSENMEFNKIVSFVILRFILARDTEKITTKMKEELVPEMMKLNPKLNPNASSKAGTPEFIDFEMNPEWLENFENSSLGKKIEEFSKLQEEGADVMLFSFVNLKHFPFFNEMNNWFMPFHRGLSFLAEENMVTKSLELMSKVGIMCNSDLYSFFFSMMTIRKEGRLTTLENFENQLTEFNQQKNADLQTRDDTTERLIGHFIQDLYRFYKLYPRRQEFRDIFNQNLDFHNLPFLQRYFSDKNDLLYIADYYLQKNHFEDALTLFQRLSGDFATDEMLFQKKGYCRQMTGDYPGALDEYAKAELINPDSKWLIRRIIQCYRAVKNMEQALAYSFRLEKMEPETPSVMLTIGSCLLEMKNYPEALKYYFKVDYLDHNSGKAWRPIAWCSFLTGKYEQARNYYQLILSSNPSYQDYTNAGHTEWALDQINNALDYYLKSIQSANNNFETFQKEFAKDVPELTAAGIPLEEIPLMLDKLRYTM